MSDIPICRLCECVPSESFDLIDIETMYYNCDTSGCPVAESGMMLTPEQWQQLMGGGEPVAYQFYDPATAKWHNFINDKHRRDTADAGYKIRALYTRPQAEQVDDAVLRDAAVRMLAEWCFDVEHNGTGWDDWDENFKDARYRDGPLRKLIDAELAVIEKERKNENDG